MTDAAAIAAELGSAVEAEQLRQRAPELARRNVMLEAGIPVDKPFGQFFAEHYTGPLDPDNVIADWYRTMLDAEPPKEVLERLAYREGEARIRKFRQALDQPRPDEEAASA